MSIFRRSTPSPSHLPIPGGPRIERRRALHVAAEVIAAGGTITEAEAAVADAVLAHAHADRAALAAHAARSWWAGVLGALDGELGDELALCPVHLRIAEARRAWTTVDELLPGFFALSLMAPGTATTTLGRHTRLLALYTGLAAPGDDETMAAAAGAHLAEELGGRSLAAHLPGAFVQSTHLEGWTSLGA